MDATRFALARATPAYAVAIDAPDPPPPRATLVAILVGLAIGVGVVVVGFVIDESWMSLAGGTLVVLAVGMFISTAGERARAGLPVHRELVEIVASTHVDQATNPFKGSQSMTTRIDYVELRFEDGTAAKREICDASLRRKIRSKTLPLPCMAVVYCRGDELHGWRHIPADVTSRRADCRSASLRGA